MHLGFPTGAIKVGLRGRTQPRKFTKRQRDRMGELALADFGERQRQAPRLRRAVNHAKRVARQARLGQRLRKPAFE